MVFFQWAALPEGRQHGTLQAVLNGDIHLCLSPDALAEISDLITRPAIQARSPNLVKERVEQFLKQLVERAEMFPAVPTSFTWPQHPDDDHLFNLAIHARVKYLVTWETRLLDLPKSSAAAAKLLRELAPDLEIVTPRELMNLLKPPPPQAPAPTE
jgi:putative PIN family toxin of toxin-antitoxin system